MSEPELTEKQLQILQMTADGREAKDISPAVGLAIDTIKHYRRKIITALGADNMHQAVAMGIRRNIIK